MCACACVRMYIVPGDMTTLEREIEEPDDEITLGALQDQISSTQELLEMVREDVRLTKQRSEQVFHIDMVRVLCIDRDSDSDRQR